MSNSITVEGSKPLIGSVKLSGSGYSALKLISASMFSNEDIFLDNVPNTRDINLSINIIQSLGGKANWIGENKLVLNGASLDSYEVPFELGNKHRPAALFTAPLIYRFGKAVIPKYTNSVGTTTPINRWIDTWKGFGMNVREDDKYLYIDAEVLKNSVTNFKISTHMGTDNAILSSIFIPGESIILNAAEEPGVEDLIQFCNKIGAEIERTEPRKIRILGKNTFHAASFFVQADKTEAVIFAVGAAITHGNITIEGVNKTHLVSFVNALSKIGCNYEFTKSELKVWHANEQLKGIDVTTYPAPGFLTDWQPYITLLLIGATGESSIHDTIYTDRFEYIKDLNRMGAKIELFRPSDLGFLPVISDDSYNFSKSQEPYTVAKFTGPFKLRGNKLHIADLKAGAVLLLAALSAEGKSEITGYELIDKAYDNLFNKLIKLGAKIY